MADDTTAWNVIGGEPVAARSDRTRPNIAPATGEPFGEVVESTPEDVDDAVADAHAAAEGWRALGVEGRRQRLLSWSAAVRERSEEIARLDAVDSGTPIRTMRVGADKGSGYTDYYANLGLEALGETIPATADHLHFTLREPYGTVGVVIPFNHPAYFAMSKTSPALAAGNTVVLKPAEQTPRSASVIVEEAAHHLGPGVLNLVHGDAKVGAAVAGHPVLQRLHFTGGVRTGLAVQSEAASSGVVKHVTLELGGKNPLIAYPDVDVDVVADAVVLGMNFTRNQGQSCGSTSRLFVHRDLAAAVTDAVVERVRAIELGLPEDDDTQMGSLVSQAHRERVLAMIDGARRDGARILTGGTAADDRFPGGAYVDPTVVTDAPQTSEIACHEVFGPVLTILDWSDEQEMLAAVNGTSYGLTAAIYCNDLTTALRSARAVEAGYLWINGVETRWKGVPFGGYKNSGVGSEHSLDELLGYTRTKAVNVLLR